jgi:hypothetical protein
MPAEAKFIKLDLQMIKKIGYIMGAEMKFPKSSKWAMQLHF